MCTLQAIRIRFKKQGSAQYISHLDLNRCMARAIRRAHLPIWNTEGFNPHPYITFALPLSIFYGSVCDIMDAKLDEELPIEEVKKKLSAQMPSGIEIYDVVEPLMKIADIAFSRYEVSLEYENKNADELNLIYKSVLEHDDLSIEKTTKHGVRIVDVKLYLTNDYARYEIKDGVIKIVAVLPSSSQENLNPSCFSAMLLKYTDLLPDFEQITRTEIYNSEMQPFK